MLLRDALRLERIYFIFIVTNASSLYGATYLGPCRDRLQLVIVTTVTWNTRPSVDKEHARTDHLYGRLGMASCRHYDVYNQGLSQGFALYEASNPGNRQLYIS